MRALVRAPRRRMHLAATRYGAEWWTHCDRVVVTVPGLEVVGLEALEDLEALREVLCVECYRGLVLAGTVAALHRVRIVDLLERAS